MEKKKGIAELLDIQLRTCERLDEELARKRELCHSAGHGTCTQSASFCMPGI